MPTPQEPQEGQTCPREAVGQSDPPRVSVVIPSLNEARHIERLLDALRQQDWTDFEVIVADGQSTDGTPDIVCRYAWAHPDLCLKVVGNPLRSIPSGLNIGIASAAGEIIVRLDGHSRPAPDYLSRCVSVLTESGAAVVGGVWDVRAGGPDVVARAICLAVSSPLGAGDALYRLNATRQPQDVDTVPFGCFHRCTWQAVDGYDQSLLTNEDYEFNLRVRQRVGAVRLDPGIRSEYVARPTWGALVRQYWRYGWWKAQMLKRHPTSLRLRQAVPLAWSGGSLALLGLAAVWPPGRLVALGVWLVYLAILILAGGRLTVTAPARRWALWPTLAISYALIHFSWGLGAWAGLVLGRQRRKRGHSYR